MGVLNFFGGTSRDVVSGNREVGSWCPDAREGVDGGVVVDVDKGGGEGSGLEGETWRDPKVVEKRRLIVFKKNRNYMAFEDGSGGGR